VGGLVSSATDLREEAGISNPATLAVIPATAYVGSSQLDILNPGTGRADLSVVAQGGTRQNLLSGNQGISMGPQAVRTFLGDAGHDGRDGGPVDQRREAGGGEARAPVRTATRRPSTRPPSRSGSGW